MALETEKVSDFARGKNQASGELGEVDAVIGREEAVEIEREVLVRGVGDDADGGAGNIFAEANLADGVGFHFDGVHAGDLPEFELFVRGAGDAVGAFEAGEFGGRSEKGFFPGGAFVHFIDDCAEFKGGVEAASKTASENAGRGFFRQICVEFCEGVAATHAGDEDSDVRRRREEFGFFFDGEADEGVWGGSHFVHADPKKLEPPHVDFNELSIWQR